MSVILLVGEATHFTYCELHMRDSAGLTGFAYYGTYLQGSAVVSDQGMQMWLCLWGQGTTGLKQVTQAKQLNVAINGFGRIGEQQAL